MKHGLLPVFLLFTASAFPQLAGTWQGLLVPAGKAYVDGTIFFLEIGADGAVRTREEVAGKDAFVVRKARGDAGGREVAFSQGPIEKKKDASGVRWCTIGGRLTYVDSSGYLMGDYSSAECRGVAGKIYLYRSARKITTDPSTRELQAWKPVFADDLKNGRKAPEIRDEERKNFRFVPIYFDHDKAEIKAEFVPFLQSMVRVVNGHSDLRIRVTGHTDADGSDAYNVDLSKRRAEAIVAFFAAQGLSRDRIRIEFKGEADPLGDNTTTEGKQINRRVDFEFI
jgi:OmpA-OmpF porin, OOP family